MGALSFFFFFFNFLIYISYYKFVVVCYATVIILFIKVKLNNFMCIIVLLWVLVYLFIVPI